MQNGSSSGLLLAVTIIDVDLSCFSTSDCLINLTRLAHLHVYRCWHDDGVLKQLEPREAQNMASVLSRLRSFTVSNMDHWSLLKPYFFRTHYEKMQYIIFQIFGWLETDRRKRVADRTKYQNRDFAEQKTVLLRPTTKRTVSGRQ